MSVHEKLWQIQKAIDPVRLKVETHPDDGEETARWAPADSVFAVVRRQLRLKKVSATPSIVEAAKGGDGTSRSKILVEFTDLDDPESSTSVDWVGESTSGIAAANSAALKGLYIATFLIDTSEPLPQWQEPIGGGGRVEPNQLFHMIHPLKAKAYLSDETFRRLLADHFAVTEVDRLGRKAAENLADILRDPEALKPYRDNHTSAGGIASEPRPSLDDEAKGSTCHADAPLAGESGPDAPSAEDHGSEAA